MQFNYNDGGRSAAGFRGDTGDCVCRSIAIAAELPYQQVYDFLSEKHSQQRVTSRKMKRKGLKYRRTASDGILVNRKWFKDYMKSLGFEWVATMTIGSGCQVHLRPEELPAGRLVVNVSRHTTAVIDGVINDTYNPDRDGTRCVYGYWIKK